MSPTRVQRKRTKGWRMPTNTVYVGRGSKWGNPFTVKTVYKTGPFDVEREGGFIGQYTGRTAAQRKAVDLFELHALGIGALTAENIRAELAGKNLACWCAPGRPCHANVLLEIANGE